MTRVLSRISGDNVIMAVIAMLLLLLGEALLGPVGSLIVAPLMLLILTFVVICLIATLYEIRGNLRLLVKDSVQSGDVDSDHENNND